MGRERSQMLRNDEEGENAKCLVRGPFYEFSLVRGSTGSAFTRQRWQVRSL